MYASIRTLAPVRLRRCALGNPSTGVSLHTRSGASAGITIRYLLIQMPALMPKPMRPMASTERLAIAKMNAAKGRKKQPVIMLQ